MPSEAEGLGVGPFQSLEKEASIKRRGTKQLQVCSQRRGDDTVFDTAPSKMKPQSSFRAVAR